MLTRGALSDVGMALTSMRALEAIDLIVLKYTILKLSSPLHRKSHLHITDLGRRGCDG